MVFLALGVSILTGSFGTATLAIGAPLGLLLANFHAEKNGGHKNVVSGAYLWADGVLQVLGPKMGAKLVFPSLFLVLLVSNLSGLFLFFPQIFMGKFSLSLLLMTIFFWGRSYKPMFSSQKEKFTLFLIGEMKFPTLSFLLSNIEILTQFFRPITLAARLWVNIWVGHLLMSSFSFLAMMGVFSHGVGTALSGILIQAGFFLFEGGIMTLQAFVFSYLVKVYFEDNLHFVEEKF